VRDFTRPDGISTASVDAFTGYSPSEYSQRQVSELFIRGTAPTADPYLTSMEVVRGEDGQWYRWDDRCEDVGTRRTRGYLVLDDAEAHTGSWNDAINGWIKRAQKGEGVGASVSPTKRTFTAYFFEPYYQPYGRSWGGPFPPAKSCRQAPLASPSPEPSESPELSPSPEGSIEPSEPPEATPPPPEEPTPKPTPKPTPEPTEPPPPEATEPPPPEATEAAQPASRPAPSESPGATGASGSPAAGSPAEDVASD
jgi:hypothetical protein